MDRGMPEEPGRVEESIDEKNNNKKKKTGKLPIWLLAFVTKI